MGINGSLQGSWMLSAVRNESASYSFQLSSSDSSAVLLQKATVTDQFQVVKTIFLLAVAVAIQTFLSHINCM